MKVVLRLYWLAAIFLVSAACVFVFFPMVIIKGLRNANDFMDKTLLPMFDKL